MQHLEVRNEQRVAHGAQCRIGECAQEPGAEPPHQIGVGTCARHIREARSVDAATDDARCRENVGPEAAEQRMRDAIDRRDIGVAALYLRQAFEMTAALDPVGSRMHGA